MNTHFISRVLTKLWKPVHRQPTLFDVNAGTPLVARFSENPFGRDDFVAAEMEKSLDRTFERQLANLPAGGTR